MSDVRNMVEACDDQESPECVILHAWANNTTRQTAVALNSRHQACYFYSAELASFKYHNF